MRRWRKLADYTLHTGSNAECGRSPCSRLACETTRSPSTSRRPSEAAPEVRPTSTAEWVLTESAVLKATVNHTDFYLLELDGDIDRRKVVNSMTPCQLAGNCC